MSPVTAAQTSLNIHASAVALRGRAILILGAAGAGKSGLALALMAQGARLVADDRVVLRVDGAGRLLASAPPAIAGLIEARGVGILRVEVVPEAEVILAVDLDRAPETRMPQSETITYLGTRVRLISGRECTNLVPILTLFLQDVLKLPD